MIKYDTSDMKYKDKKSRRSLEILSHHGRDALFGRDHMEASKNSDQETPVRTNYI